MSLLGPKLVSREAIPAWYGLLAFPLMVLGPSVVGIGLTVIAEGAPGIRRLAARMCRWRVSPRWYASALGIPPALILLVLISLDTFISSDFTPGFFPIALSFGVVAGFFEEIGWTGFAYPRMRARYGWFRASVVLGLAWGLWHLPVVDYLGAASPHGAYLPTYFLAFVGFASAMRVLICWVSSSANNSVLLAQIMHASSTGFLAALSPGAVSAAQEAGWYAVYAVTLWIAVVVVAAVPFFRPRIDEIVG